MCKLKLIFLVFHLLASGLVAGQVIVKTVQPSVSKTDSSGEMTVSFNTAELLLDNHTLNSKFLKKEGVLSAVYRGQKPEGIVQVFPWNSTVKLKEAGFLVGFQDINYVKDQTFNLEITELIDQLPGKTISAYKVVIPASAVKMGAYLSFYFQEPLALTKGRFYAIHLYPTEKENQEIKLQLAETNFLSFAFQSAGSKLIFPGKQYRRPDLNIYLLAE